MLYSPKNAVIMFVCFLFLWMNMNWHIYQQKCIAFFTKKSYDLKWIFDPHGHILLSSFLKIYIFLLLLFPFFSPSYSYVFRTVPSCFPALCQCLTHESVVVLQWRVDQTADSIHAAQLHLHVCQITHDPVQIVGHLHGGRAEAVSEEHSLVKTDEQQVCFCSLPWERKWVPDPPVPLRADCIKHCL